MSFYEFLRDSPVNPDPKEDFIADKPENIFEFTALFYVATILSLFSLFFYYICKRKSSARTAVVYNYNLHIRNYFHNPVIYNGIFNQDDQFVPTD